MKLVIKMENQNKTGAIILAAGKGTRLGCTDKPKVMLEIGGKPIVSYIVEELEKLGFERNQICLVVGFQKQTVKDHFEDKVVFAGQDEQLGTAHATFVGSQALDKNIKTILIMGGDDSAFYSGETLEKFINVHIENKAKLSLLTVEVDDPSALGRVVRDENGDFIDVLEKEEVTEEQKSIREISTGTYCFDRAWFEEKFPKMKLIEGLGEYGLPNMVDEAVKEAVKIQAVKLENQNEWFGINTKEELEEADKRKNL